MGQASWKKNLQPKDTLNGILIDQAVELICVEHTRELRMNQQVGFKKYVAIDWSGAKKPINTPTIQVAEYVPATGIVSLRHPPEGTPGDLWSREAVVDYVQQTVKAVDEGPVLIGFDFAFANPYCDQSTYFPGAVAPPQNYQALWRAVEQQCNGFGNFYGAPFFRNPCSPYRQFYRYPGFRDNHYATRFRITEQAAAAQVGLNPASVFHCIGPKQVGTGSVAGMRVLHEFRGRVQAGRMKPISIWPFDVTGVPVQSTVVEIYPRLFLDHAERDGIQPTAENIPAFCRHFGAELEDPHAVPTADQRDALVSAAGMGWLTQQEAIAWQVPPCAAKYEGWIFGVPVPPEPAP